MIVVVCLLLFDDVNHISHQLSTMYIKHVETKRNYFLSFNLLNKVFNSQSLTFYCFFTLWIFFHLIHRILFHCSHPYHNNWDIATKAEKEYKVFIMLLYVFDHWCYLRRLERTLCNMRFIVCYVCVWGWWNIFIYQGFI